MNSRLHTFIDIFNTVISDGSEEIQLRKIIIPIIQRDYAQGRRNPDVDRVRNRFLDSLLNAVNNSPIALDFVYGDINEEGVMTPLDGQQRLTTLFLLHWFAAKKERISPDEYEFLSGFGYETRYSARDFCQCLISFEPSFSTIISEEIIDQSWFPLDWKKDPTISSMLVMIDAINDKFGNVDNLWNRLKQGAISFYFLPIKDMGLTDELYIKMNSRGKPLTRFEHFKAELEHDIRSVNETVAKRVMRKIDLDWTDLLWQYRDSGSGSEEDEITDDEFLRYFRFVCDIICYQRGESPQGKSTDEFDLLADYFSGDTDSVLKNIETLESFFDCWCNIENYRSPTEFCNSFMTFTHEPGKIIVDSKNIINIFEDCLHSYADKSGKVRQFPLNRIILLYAITVYLRNRSRVSENDFHSRLRIVNNLIQNSEDEISDRLDRNRLPAILKQADSIMIDGTFDESIENSFNVNQLNEEKEKKGFLTVHPEISELLFKLEDHHMLKGQIGILGLDHIDYTERFISLFLCDWDLIDCALMALGDYGQMERNEWRYQYGSKGMQIAWHSLFHKSANRGFENTRRILIELLSQSDSFTNEYLKNIAESYVEESEKNNLFTWRYYYIKYDIFRPGSFGKYGKSSLENSQYLYTVLQTKTNISESSYVPFLKGADPSNCKRENLGQRLVYDNHYIIMENSAYFIKDNSSDEIVDSINIKQNENGIDVENRIEVLKNYLKTH